MLVLDTNHVTVLGYASEPSRRLIHKLDVAGQETATTIVCVEEQLRGWLAEIHRLTDAHRQIAAYEALHHRLEFFASWRVLPWNSVAADLFVGFRRDGIRIGTMDLKIACITLVHDGTLLTQNIADFASVPGLRVENWLD